MFKQRMKALEKIISHADRAYYLLKDNEPLALTDDEYTLLRAEWEALKKLNQTYNSTLTPGFVTDESNIVGITEPMLSIYEYMDADKFLALKTRFPDHTFEKKYNGVEIRLIYNKKGILERVHLRGDGKRGRDITHRRELICNIPKKIRNDGKEHIHITGEVVCFLDDHVAYCDKFEIEDRPPKNIVGNLLGREEAVNTDTEDADNDDTLNLYFIAYHVSSNIRKKCRFYPKLLQWLEKEGFNTPPALDDFPEQLPESDFSIDGIVIKDNVLSHWEETQHTGYYRYCGAYKYPKNIKHATVKGVVWGICADGTLKGVLRITPVTFNGQTFETCPFLYSTYHIRNRLSAGSKVEIGYYQHAVKLMGVMEKCLDEEIQLPTHCPYCQSPLFLFNKDAYRCIEKETCPGQLTWRLQRTCSSRGLNIAPIKAGYIPEIIKENKFTSIEDIFKLSQGDIKGVNFSTANLNRITNTLKMAPTHVSLANWLTAAGIYGLGEARSVMVEQTLRDLHSDVNPYTVMRLLTDVKRMYQLFDADAVKIVGYALTNYDEIVAFLRHFHFNHWMSEESGQSRIVVSISGRLEFRRSDLIERLTKLGYCCDHTVTKQSKYFLTINNQSVSKAALAKRYGVRCVDITGMTIEDIVKYLGLNT